MLKNFDFKPGKIIDETLFHYFDFDKPMSKQNSLVLGEDIFTVKYPNGIMLWLDWLPSLDKKKGKFVIQITTVEYETGKFYYKQTRLKRKMVEFILEAHEIAKDLSERRGNGTLKIKKESIDVFLNQYWKLNDKKRNRIRLLGID